MGAFLKILQHTTHGMNKDAINFVCSLLEVLQGSSRVLEVAMCQHVAHCTLRVHVAHVGEPLVVHHLLLPRLPLLVHGPLSQPAPFPFHLHPHPLCWAVGYANPRTPSLILSGVSFDVFCNLTGPGQKKSAELCRKRSHESILASSQLMKTLNTIPFQRHRGAP